MRLEILQDGGSAGPVPRSWRFELTLSRRNLLSLLRVLEMPDFMGWRIDSSEIYAGGGRAENAVVAVRCEQDDLHYTHPLRSFPAPGRMPLEIEQFLAQHRVPGSVEFATKPICLPSEGVRPLRHRPGPGTAAMYGQERVWVDYHGCEHDIHRLGLADAQEFLDYARMSRFAIYMVIAPGIELSPDDEHIYDQIEAWVETVPVVRALKRRIADLDGGSATSDGTDGSELPGQSSGADE